MKRYWLCLIGLLSIFSCNNSSVEIKIHWESLCDLSGVDFSETPIELEFSNFHRSKIYKLDPNKTETIKLEEGMRLISQKWPGELMIYIYPDIHTNGINSKDEDRFRKHNAMEIFLYNPNPVKESEESIMMRPHEKILAYQYYLYKDDIVYVIISRNNCIKKSIDEITKISIPEGTPLDKIFDFMNKNNLRECFYIPKLAFYSDNMDAYGGLIVNSGLSDTGIILIPPYGNLYRGLENALHQFHDDAKFRAYRGVYARQKSRSFFCAVDFIDEMSESRGRACTDMIERMRKKRG